MDESPDPAFVKKTRDNPATAINYANYPSVFRENYTPIKPPRPSKLQDKEKCKSTMSAIRICARHTNTRLEYFCENHHLVCCKECLSPIHSLCRNVVNLEVASKGTKQSNKFTELNTKLKQTTQALQSIHEREKAASDSLKMSDNVPTIEEKDGMSFSTSAVLNKHSISNQTTTKEDVGFLVFKAINYMETFDVVQKSGTDDDAYVLMHTTKTFVSELEKYVQEKQENVKVKMSSLKRLSLKFSKHNVPGLSMLRMNSDDTLDISSNSGLIVQKTKTFPPKDIRHKGSSANPLYHNAENQIQTFKFVSDIDLTEAALFSIYGLTITDNDFLLLCDSNNRRILVCDDNDVFKYQINTRYLPWDITYIPEPHLSVTSSTQEDHWLQFIDTKQNAFVKEMKIKHSDQGGITYASKLFYVGTNKRVQVFDQKGHKMKAIPSPSKPHYIINNEHGDLILVSDQEVYSVSLDGVCIFSYKSPSLLSPGKPAVDNHGNIFIPGLFSHNVHKISSEGKFIDIVLKDSNKIHFPTAVCFNRSCTKLYVANNAGCSIKVFSVTTV